MAPVVGARTASKMEFCQEDQIVRDYLAPLRDLPPVSGFPSSGRLRIGPSRLRLYVPRGALVQVGRQRFEVHGMVADQHKGKQRLNWTAQSSLDRMDQGSGEAFSVRQRRQQISTVNDFAHSQFGFWAGVKPGIYRLTIEFETPHAGTVVRYREYFRAVKARSDLRLVKSFTSLSPGEFGYLRIDNYGTARASYGFNYGLTNAAGEDVPTETVSGNIALRLEPGYASRCIVFKAPATAPPGEYQVAVQVSDRLRPTRQRLTGPIQIVP
jgi:hypothetical protein